MLFQCWAKRACVCVCRQMRDHGVCCVLPAGLCSEGIWCLVMKPYDAWWNHSCQCENTERAHYTRWSFVTGGLCFVQSRICWIVLTFFLPSLPLSVSILWISFLPIQQPFLIRWVWEENLHVSFHHAGNWEYSDGGASSTGKRQTHCLLCVKIFNVSWCNITNHNISCCLKLPSWSAAITAMNISP